MEASARGDELREQFAIGTRILQRQFQPQEKKHKQELERFLLNFAADSTLLLHNELQQLN